MHPDKRRAGRAIRKARRDAQRQAVEQLPQVLETFTALAQVAGDAFAYLGRVFSEFGTAVANAYREAARRLAWMQEQERRKEFEWRLSHRALTTGRE
jgi:hypothetical protein